MRLLLDAILRVVDMGHFSQSMFSIAVPMMLISLISCFNPCVAISHPFKEYRPCISSFVMLPRAGSLRVDRFGRLYSDNVEILSSVDDDSDSTVSESAMRIEPVIFLRPSSAISVVPVAATVMFPSKVPHWLSLATSSGPLIVKEPTQSVGEIIC